MQIGGYRGCIGPATHRSVAPGRAGHGYIYCDETNEFWEITLPHALPDVPERARAEADRRIALAREHLGDAPSEQRPALDRMLAEAGRHLASSREHPLDTDDVDAAATALRQATRAQVRAAQVVTAATGGKTWGS